MVRRRPSMRNLALAFATASLSLVTTSQVLAQAQDGQFSVQRFEPAIGPRNFLTVEGARVQGKWSWSAGAMFNYSASPLVVVSCQSATNCEDPNAISRENIHVIKDMFTWDLAGSVNAASFLQFGLRLPLSYVSGSGIRPDLGRSVPNGISEFSPGDPTIEAKARLWGEPTDPFVLGAAVDVSFPVANAVGESSYIGNSSPITAGIRGIFDGEMGPLSFGLNLRGLFRQESTLGATTVGHEFRYGAAGGYRLTPILRAVVEGSGTTAFSAAAGTNTLEVDGGLQIAPLSSRLLVTAGGGVGILEGVGVPTGRAIVGIAWVEEMSDRDDDGIADKDDDCPTVPEDVDGVQDEDGCPDLDNDFDRIPDAKDTCPAEPETINGYKDTDGCPDEVSDRDHDSIPDTDDKCPDDAGKVRSEAYYGCPDKDEDGVPDLADKCPEQPEDTDGFEDTDGCPDPDNDKDGLNDDRDECTDEPETLNKFKDEDGCPDTAPDSDGDGITDQVDKCPKAPETYNGVADDDGCPDGKALANVTGNQIEITEKVEFETNSDAIKGKRSFKVLDAVVQVLEAYPAIRHIEVAGHTDDTGAADHNRTLSTKRAESVRTYLVSKGVKSERLQAKGYGPDKPIADNKKPAGRAKNRRVEFNIHKEAAPAPASGTSEVAPSAGPAPALAPAPKP